MNDIEMNDKLLLTFGALLHDVGKVVFRGISERKTHSELGGDFLQDCLVATPQAKKKIIEQVRYHHARELSKASLAPNSLAYITYYADNISAGMDRKDEGSDSGFDRGAKLRKIFNIINEHRDDNTLELPSTYNGIREEIRKELTAGLSYERVGSLLNLLEKTLSEVPSSTDKSQLIDVSLFDHLKTTAAIAVCIYDYLSERGVGDYKRELFDKNTSGRYWDEPMFLLMSCDMSGIQDFIYQISGTGALKQLRARSFYLEIMLEHCLDELLRKLDLTRSNLIYTGGGHAYALLPNTSKVKQTLETFILELKDWLVSHFGIELFLACSYAVCTGHDLSNKTEGKQIKEEKTPRVCPICTSHDLSNKAEEESQNKPNPNAKAEQEKPKRYRRLFRQVAENLSEVKQNRYNAKDLAYFNFPPDESFDSIRECNECHRSDVKLTENEGTPLCTLCNSLREISPQLIRSKVFSVKDAITEGKVNLELPFAKYLTCYSVEEYKEQNPNSIQVYTKNEWHTGDLLSTHIWMGDYTAEQNRNGISDYAKSGITLANNQGIQRLGILRADVDNLGDVFTEGIPDDKISLSRSATLSRQLSYFFKYQINEILERGQYRVQVIYSGGDDLFLAGNWSDIIYAALDIRKALDEFTGNGVLTISCGIGIYDEHYPIARMAKEVEELEDKAKNYVDKTTKKEKNAIALWQHEGQSRDGNSSGSSIEDEYCMEKDANVFKKDVKSSNNTSEEDESFVFSWDEFITQVMPLKEELASYFNSSPKGSSFIYQLLGLLRNRDTISVPRLAYLLARSFEDLRNKDEEKVRMRIFNLALNSKTKKRLICALEWYIYSVREVLSS